MGLPLMNPPPRQECSGQSQPTEHRSRPGLPHTCPSTCTSLQAGHRHPRNLLGNRVGNVPGSVNTAREATSRCLSGYRVLVSGPLCPGDCAACREPQLAATPTSRRQAGTTSHQPVRGSSWQFQAQFLLNKYCFHTIMKLKSSKLGNMCITSKKQKPNKTELYPLPSRQR